MKTIRATLSILALLTIAPAGTVAADVIHDPYVERFRIGDFRSPEAVVVDDGWPAGLLTPLGLDAAWVEASTSLLAADALATDDDLLAWRLAGPVLETADAARAWFASHRAAHRLLLDANAGERLDVAPTLDAPFARETLMLQASRLWEQGDLAAAGERAATLVAHAGALGLEPEERFLWDLRRRRLTAAAGASRPGGLWTGLLDLGPYDSRSGWAVWLACRRARGESPVPPGTADHELGLLLARAGETWLAPDELAASGFPRDVEAGLGALTLPGEALAAHFARFAEPPDDGWFQGYWLRGQRRRDPGDGAWYEELARLPGLKDGHRLDMWRRASEARLLDGEWAPALADLREGAALVGQEASAWMERLFRHWLEQVVVLALVEGRTDDARQVWRLATGGLPPDDAARFREEAAHWQARVVPDAPPVPVPDGVQENAARRVAAGEALALDAAAVALPDAVAWRDRMWRLWARWGLGLVDAARTAGVPRLREHREQLARIVVMEQPRERHAAACALVGRALRGRPAAAPVLDWALAHDIQRRAGGTMLPGVSPLVDLAARAHPGDDPADLWYRHALLGAALAADDLRGLLAVAVALPSPGLTASERLHFLYPVPTAPWLRAALAAAPVAPEWLLAVARNESLFEPGVRSRAGALGYMQIMPFHYPDAARLPGPTHWSHAAVSLARGAELLAGEAERFDQDPYRTIAAYNAGAGAVRRWDRQLGGHAARDAFLAWIGYDETRRYTEKVVTDREVYRWILAH